MDSAGTVYFGVWTGDASTVHSTAGLNNGVWHHVVGELGPGGLALYVDGALADSDTSVTAGQSYSGYWRIGGDSSWADAAFIVADIDDVAIYPTELSAAKVQSHYTASGH
jgi:hypothetical protein